VVDRPAIHWVVEEAIGSGATDILIITGREKRVIEDYFDGSIRWDHYLKGNDNSRPLRELEELTSKARFHFIRQRQPRGLGDAILQTEDHIGSEPFLVILGDTVNVGDPPVARQLWDAYGKLGRSPPRRSWRGGSDPAVPSLPSATGGVGRDPPPCPRGWPGRTRTGTKHRFPHISS